MTDDDRPQVDVVIPVHALDRPIRRAVESVFAGAARTRVRVTVVCHRIDPTEIESRLEGIAGVRTIACDDPVASPAAPMNAGLEAADAPWFSRLDSDDVFEQGAIDAWMDAARRGGADLVIAPLRATDGRIAYAPLTRPFRHRRLDPVRDRLSYRTAPFGLTSVDLIRALGARYTAGLESGEDLEFGLMLWFGAARVDLAVHAPAYAVRDDAAQRTTAVPRELAAELAPPARAIASPWFARRTAAERESIVIKLARVHLLGAIRSRDEADLDGAALDVVEDLLAAFDAAAPRWQVPFSRADSAAFDLLRAGELVEAGRMLRAARRWTDDVLAPTARGTMHRESTLRRYARYRLPR